MTTTTSSALPLLIEEVEVRSVELLTPTFVRVELGSPGLADLETEGPLYDQRIKLLFPDGDRPLPSFVGAGADWYTTWMQRPERERGHMRTYTIREVRGSGAETRVVVDFVLHVGGAHGPGGDWAAAAAVGDRVVVTAPRRGVPYGGIEFAPGDATQLLLVGDETAVPAISAILEQLPATARGSVFLEVPSAADRLILEHPPGVGVTWLPREGAQRGAELHAAVLDHLGDPTLDTTVEDADVDLDLWETPEFSSSGEDVATTARSVGHEWDGLYAWIAGESKVVTGLRRALVRDLGIDRHQVAFMGYWREGVAMRS